MGFGAWHQGLWLCSGAPERQALQTRTLFWIFNGGFNIYVQLIKSLVNGDQTQSPALPEVGLKVPTPQSQGWLPW